MKRRALLSAGCSLAALGGTNALSAPQPIRVAIISSTTGVLSAFGTTNSYAHELFAERLAAGIETQHLGKQPVRLELYDAASSSDKAARHAAALAADGVHMVLASGTPEICNPVADVCEAANVPCVTTVAPWQTWFHGRKGDPHKGFKCSFHFFVGLEDFASVYASLFKRSGLGAQVGGIWPDDIDGGAFLGAFPAAMQQQGMSLFDPGRLQLATPDYTAIATRLRDARVPMVTGVLPPPVAMDFFAAARKVGYRPRMASIAKAFPFPDTVAQVGQADIALTNEVWWSPAWPFRSALTQATSEQVAQEYEQRTGKQWIQTLGFSHAIIDLAAQVIQQTRAASRPALIETLRRIKARTVVGPINFIGRMPSLNVCSTPAVGGQWLRDANGRWVLQVVDNTRSPFIPVTAKFNVNASAG